MDLILQHVEFEVGSKGLHTWHFQYEAGDTYTRATIDVKVRTKTDRNVGEAEASARDNARRLAASISGSDKPAATPKGEQNG